MSERQSRARYYETIASGECLDLEAEGHLGPQRVPPADLAAMVAKGLR